MFIPATPTTPLVRFSKEELTLEIIGRSIPEDAMDFYKPVFGLLRNSENRVYKTLKVVFQLEYFNTHSSRVLLDILKALEKLKDLGMIVNTFWVCDEDDEEIIHFGEDIKGLIQVPMEITLLDEDKYDERIQRANWQSKVQI
ncbi:MAG: DUF1987 domain-containing protein [Flavobacteriales bacterium]|nr:DUF1987 domain-containing protein [Flavobacteriales bacterium]MCB9191435.1 DUF1987 domain-containing protein [Flavobacteriales bacterium]MCB9203939.1 DUF1987 domain-containing protein [Flavobacteriales bacterium]